MFLSKRSNGVYYLWVTDDLGRRQKVSTGCTLKSDALKFVQEYKREEHKRKQNLQRVSLSQFTDDYLAYIRHTLAPKSQESVGTSLRELRSVIGDMPLHKIGVREIEQFLAEKKDKASAVTARTYFVTLASAFETAKRWNCILSNPFRLVEKPELPEIQPAYFSKEEFKKLIGVIMDNEFRELCICAVFTGMRMRELTALRWKDVDLEHGIIFVQNSNGFTTKSKRNRVIPMTKFLWEMLTARKERATCELVFHSDGNRLTKEQVSKRFKRKVALAELDKSLHFHSLRHTFASWLAQSGVSLLPSSFIITRAALRSRERSWAESSGPSRCTHGIQR